MGVLDNFELYRVRAENVRLVERIRELEELVKQLDPPKRWVDVDHEALSPWQLNRVLARMTGWDRPRCQVLEIQSISPYDCGWTRYECLMSADSEGDCMVRSWYVRKLANQCKPDESPAAMSAWEFSRLGIDRKAA